MFFKKKKKKENSLELYNEEEYKLVEDHIKQYFGTIAFVFHEFYSPDIHVDIFVIEPSAERNYYTLVTMGMGAHVMHVDSTLDPFVYGRAELLIYLPADWDVRNNEMQWYWPLMWLKKLARLPIEQNSWLGLLHTIENDEPFANNTELCGIMLSLPSLNDPASQVCTLPDSSVVNFLQMIPIYKEEMDYKVHNDGEHLLEKLATIQYDILDIHRNNVCRL